ncbi:PREDICTED: protein enabled homolog [Amphimedon queenslandica]|uniref:Uncharacterized protein n=1 Tax=Amphimedon queenslandica TaxID=400682 RepID=A0A1X7VJL1_AMPQE|nr:PREDICTED: protein enabled homolog [Amphimedon queenslandica]|eukprot:XP_011410081.2 PREDICTED: protein enabled homolog [Amphimedon queenslandica]
MEGEDNFISQTSNVLPQSDKSHVILDPVIAIDLAAPLPDLPALSLPENADATYTDIITAMEASDNNEENDEYMCMDQSISEAPLISVPTPDPVREDSQPDFLSIETETRTTNTGTTPYEVPVSLRLPSARASSSSFPLSPPSQPPPSPPLGPPSPFQPPPSPLQPPPPSSLEAPPSPPPFQPPSFIPPPPPMSSPSPPPPQHIPPPLQIPPVESPTEEVYEDIIPEASPSSVESATYDNANEPTSLYMAIDDQDSPDDTYDDIPANESYVEILPNNQVQMTVRPPQNQQAYVAENSSETTAVLTGLSEEAPPSYDALFGGPPPPAPAPAPGPTSYVAPRQGHDIRGAFRPPVVSQTPAPVQVSRDMPDNGDGDENWCLSTVNSSPIKTGIYLFIFLLGIFVPLGMLGLGVGIYITGSSTDSTSLSGNVPIYLIVMGSCSSFFVCWHTTALVSGAYIRAHNTPRRHSTSSCCLRVLHCGGLVWWGALGYLSYIVYQMRNDITFDLLTIALLGFIVFQYLMVLYCLLEAFVDCRVCVRERCRDTDDDDRF